jgi:hypothetical protein
MGQLWDAYVSKLENEIKDRTLEKLERENEWKRLRELVSKFNGWEMPIGTFNWQEEPFALGLESHFAVLQFNQEFSIEFSKRSNFNAYPPERRRIMRTWKAFVRAEDGVLGWKVDGLREQLSADDFADRIAVELTQLEYSSIGH